MQKRLRVPIGSPNTNKSEHSCSGLFFAFHPNSELSISSNLIFVILLLKLHVTKTYPSNRYMHPFVLASFDSNIKISRSKNRETSNFLFSFSPVAVYITLRPYPSVILRAYPYFSRQLRSLYAANNLS